MDYEFRAVDGSKPVQLELSPRLKKIQAQFRDACQRYAPPFGSEIALQWEKSGGAQGRWSDRFDCFEVTAPLQYNEYVEAIIAHEIAHPIVQLHGHDLVFMKNKEIGTGLRSMFDHPYVFYLLKSAGYDQEQRLLMEKMGADMIFDYENSELPDELNDRDLRDLHVFAAVSVFQVYLLAPNEYSQIMAAAQRTYPYVASVLEILEKCWRRARRKQRGYAGRTRVFQKLAIQELDLENRVELIPLSQIRSDAQEA